MRSLIFIGALLMSSLSFSQARKFINQAKEALQIVDTVSVIDEMTATEEEYDLLTEGSERLEDLFLAKLKALSRPRPDELKESNTLAILSNLATSCWKGAHYVNARKWKRLTKFFQRAAYGSTTPFNIMRQYSFRIPLVDNFGMKFYYDRSGLNGGLNLYSGTRPKSAEEREEHDPVPLVFFSERVLVEKFMREIRRKRILPDLKRGGFSFVGVSIKIDQNTLHRNRIPTGRVVVVFGARRMKDLKIDT